MSSDRIVAWVQVVTGLAVLIGLVLVLVELRLSSKLAYTAQVGAAVDIHHQNRQSQIGETPTAGVFVGGCLSPAELSDEEIFARDYLRFSLGTKVLVARQRRFFGRTLPHAVHMPKSATGN
jgi:hypothetical protein